MAVFWLVCYVHLVPSIVKCSNFSFTDSLQIHCLKTTFNRKNKVYIRFLAWFFNVTMCTKRFMFTVWSENTTSQMCGGWGVVFHVYSWLQPPASAVNIWYKNWSFIHPSTNSDRVKTPSLLTSIFANILCVRSSGVSVSWLVKAFPNME